MSKDLQELEPEELVIRKAKYRVRNAEGKYEVVYLETSADQVIESNEKKFVTQAEKDKIGQYQTAIDGIDGKIGTAKTEAINESKQYTNTKIGEIDGAYKAADEAVKSAAATTAQQKADAVKNELAPKITAVEGKANQNESGIAEIKGLLAKNTTAYVAPNVAGIAEVAPSPKVGDIVYVIESKRAYIYKGEEELVVFEAPAEEVPSGWVLLDDIQTDVDLGGYETTAHAEATYMKKTDKVAEGNLEDGLKNKINGKLDQSQVNTSIDNKLNPVKNDLQGKINAKLDTSAVNGKIDEKLNPAKEELKQAINAKAQEVTSAFQASDAELTKKINNLIPTLAKEQPSEKAEGHVWLEILGEDTVE